MNYSELERLADELENKRETFLQENGWVYSGGFPGCCCLWSKKLMDGRTIAVEQHVALSIQEFLDSE